jgi:DNA-binding transcriptional MerR regulator
MGQSAIKIPEKIFFKIGEVCELVGVQAHVLRYWETEFSMLAPQKNRSGQRTYRRRDVEIALRIKELLYDEKFTIAGAKKKLAEEIRGGNRPKAASAQATQAGPAKKLSTDDQAGLFNEEDYFPPEEAAGAEFATSAGSINFTDENSERKAAFVSLAQDLNEILQILNKEENGRK